MPFTDLVDPVPAELKTAEFVLRPIGPDDAELDYAAVMDTREYLRQWRQSSWPEDDFTVEANRKDLVELEERHAAHRAFTYTVLDLTGTRCLGCVYVFPTSATFLAACTVRPVADEEWGSVDAVVFFWVRSTQMAGGMDERLLSALRAWFRDTWRFGKTLYATSAGSTQQVQLVERSGLNRKFELLEPGKPQKRLVFG